MAENIEIPEGYFLEKQYPSIPEGYEIEIEDEPTRLGKAFDTARSVVDMAFPFPNLEDAAGGITKFDNGYTYGFGRKAGSLMNAIGSWPVDRGAEILGYKNTPSFADRYNEIVDSADEAAQNFAERHPYRAAAIELGGAFANPVNRAAGNYIGQGVNVSSKLARGVGVGGGIGALNALGQAKGTANLSEDVRREMGIGAGINAAFPLAGIGIRSLGRAAQPLLGLATGTGDAIKTAVDAGKRGSNAFLKNMRDKIPMTEVVNEAQDALSKLKSAKNQAYKTEMSKLGKNNTKLDIKPLKDSLRQVKKEYMYNGYNSAVGKTKEALKRLEKELKDFEKAPNAHTASGFDKLKQAIQDINFPFEERNARRIVGNFSNEVKKAISNQNPQYAGIMKDYQAASDEIEELSKTLLGGQKKVNPTNALKKLQKAFRNNAQSGYGNNTSLLKSSSQMM